MEPNTSENKPFISAKNVVKRYQKQTLAVDSISFEIKQGECFGFLGPNGAGKTTTIKMIHCVSPITSGTITVNGFPSNIDNRKIKTPRSDLPAGIAADRRTRLSR